MPQLLLQITRHSRIKIMRLNLLNIIHLSQLPINPQIVLMRLTMMTFRFNPVTNSE
jgi:hypothetical protein